MKFSERLKAIRLDKGMTQKDVYTKLRISPNGYASYEQGRTEPGIETIIQLCNIFEVSIDYLLGAETEYGIKEHGEIQQYPIDEQILLRAYRTMTPGKKKALFQMLDLDENIIKQKRS